MRIGCLQFAPQLGDVDQNLNRADAVLSKSGVKDLDLLVLPELAFSGYNFKSLKHISPYLEPTAAGISSLWARTTALKYDCVVTVGYPEKVDISPKWPTSPEYYSSTITVNRDGETIANYRKSFLYYTDETWALEGPDGFYDGEIEDLGNVAMGICMDLNPYKFEAPWSAWEFAYHILHRQANLAIISMAWLTREDARSYSRSPKEPDMETLAYWVARLEPVIRADGEQEILVVFANRSGTEDDAVYAGTSAVLGIHHGEVKLYGVLGRGERELLVVDTSKRPQAKLVHDSHSSFGQPASSKQTLKSKTINPLDTEQSRHSKSSAASKSSAVTQDSAVSDKSQASSTSTVSSTGATNGSALDNDEEGMASIGEILAAATPLSPVEPRGGHAFFGMEPTPAERRSLRSTIEVKQDVPVQLQDLSVSGTSISELPKRPSVPIPNAPPVLSKSPEMVQRGISSNETGRPLKSAVNGHPPNRNVTPALEQGSNGVFERPSSPKSRNASRTRQPPAHQEAALYTHDLAGEFPDSSRHAISRNGTRSRNGLPERNQTPGMVRGGKSYRGRDDDGPRSAGDADLNLPEGIEIVYSDADSDDDEGGLMVPGFGGSPPRPKSVGW